MTRALHFSIFRCNPQDPSAGPRMETFVLQDSPRMTVLMALTRIREEQDPSLAFDACCRSAVCGSCAMVINGRPSLACRTRTLDLPVWITLLPLPFFQLVGDLCVDTGTWFRDMHQRVESWVHARRQFDPDAEEERMDQAVAERIYELDRCIECGCCLAACGSALMRRDFLGAVGLVRVARFLADPRDRRTEQEFFDLVGTDQGMFGCLGLLGCEDVCPKQLPLQDQLGYLRRRLAMRGLRRLLPW